jgi:hypothetical protein
MRDYIDYDKQFAKDSGEFFLPETKKYFSFRPTNNPWALENGLLHEIDVLDGLRFGIVRKTLAYIAIDENQYGKPVIAKWDITKRRIFQSIRAI